MSGATPDYPQCSAYLYAVMRLRVLIYCWCDFWRRPRAVSLRVSSRRKNSYSNNSHFKVMFSTPTAIPSSICLVRTAFEIVTMDCRPEEQSLFTVEMGTSTGMPAAVAAARDT